MAKGIDDEDVTADSDSISLNDDEKLRLALERYIQERTSSVQEELDSDDQR